MSEFNNLKLYLCGFALFKGPCHASFMERFFREAIKKHRREANLTQEDLGERSGMKRDQVGAIERGERSLSEEEFVKLCIGLEMDLSTVFADACRSLWMFLRSQEEGLRLDMGKEPPKASTSSVVPEEIVKVVEEYFDHGKEMALSAFKLLSLRLTEEYRFLPFLDAAPGNPSSGTPRQGKVKKSKSGEGGSQG
jgi:transcriptional regulator with XRE-family HTH domain